MTLGFDEAYDMNVKNKRKAKAAMGKSVCLLFVISALSFLANKAAAEFISDNILKIEAFLVSIVKCFKVKDTYAVIAIRDFIASGVLFEFVMIVLSFVTMVLPAAVFAKLTGFKRGECFNFDGRLIKGFFSVFCMVQLITVAVSFFSNGLYGFLVPSDAGAYTGEFSAYSPDVFMLVMEILFTCILVPVVEEYVFRGVLFGYLRRYGLTFGVLSGAILFGIAHTAPVQSVYAFAFGILSAFVYSVTGNLKTSVLLHALNNLVTVVMGYAQVLIGETLSSLVYCVYFLTVVLFAFLGMRRLISDGGLCDEYAAKERINDGNIREKPGLAQIFTVPLLLYVALYVCSFILQVI